MVNEFFDGVMGCEFASELRAHEFGGGPNTDAAQVQAVSVPTGANRWLIT